MSQCDITPISAFQSTNLSNKIDSFNRLSDRILRSLGYPFINVEVHRDNLYENISISCEMFTKYAGYTREILIFDSRLYEYNVGIRLDLLLTLNDSNNFKANVSKNPTVAAIDSGNNMRNDSINNPQFTTYVEPRPSVFICTSAIDSSYFTTLSSISAILSGGSFINEIFDNDTYNLITGATPSLTSYFIPSQQRCLTILGDKTKATTYNNSFDYDLMEYRKVIALTDFEQGSTTGINTLFTIEQTLAQQTYFSYAMGNYGFDLISWYVLKDWIKNREKMLATNPSWDFNDRTQIMRLYPQPKAGQSASQYYGVVTCYVERPIKDIIKEQWVYQYALALTKITLGRIRGKYAGTTLFGGGSVNADMLAEGLAEKDKLEQQLYTGATPGLGGDSEPTSFFVG